MMEEELRKWLELWPDLSSLVSRFASVRNLIEKELVAFTQINFLQNRDRPSLVVMGDDRDQEVVGLNPTTG